MRLGLHIELTMAPCNFNLKDEHEWKTMSTIKVPEDLGTLPAGKLADLLYRLRESRKVIEGKAEEIKTEETRIKNYLIEQLPKSALERITGLLANASLTRSVIPHVQDWDKLYAFIEKNDAFELLQKRPVPGAFRERWASGMKIPGVEQYSVLDISVTKRGKNGD